MYQAVYPWLCRDQFKLCIPGTYNDEMWNIPQRVMVDKIRAADPPLHQVEISVVRRCVEIVTEYESPDPTTPGPSIESASTKLLAFIQRRDCHVVYHGPDCCSDKRPWNRFEHFHITYLPKFRPGVDTIWANVNAQHRGLCNQITIPHSQTTK